MKMRELSRYELYTYVRDLIDNYEEGRVLIANFLGDLLDDFRMVLDVHTIILKDIENYFLYDSPLTNSLSKENIIDIFGENYRNLNTNSLINEDEYTNALGNFAKANDEYYTFNKLIKFLNDITDRFFENVGFYKIFPYDLEEDKYKILNNKVAEHRVFLSYAFKDRLYAFCLFIYMYFNSIFLYVDFLFCGELNDGVDIKNNLYNQLSLSSQLLFLRSVNSELNIRGSANIRGWCSWELGTFYTLKNINKDSKFYINLYGPKGKGEKNRQLDGVKPLFNIIKGVLV